MTVFSYSVCTISRVLEVLQAAGKLDQSTVDAVRTFVSENNTFTPDSGKVASNKRKADEFNTQEKAKRSRCVGA